MNNKLLKIIQIFTLLVITNAVYANYANTVEGENKIPKPTDKEINESAERVSLPKSLNVPPEWKPFLNPAYEEFWMEGDHKPDAGLVLFARNPTKENAKLWLIRMETKSKYMQKLVAISTEANKELIKEGVIEDRFNFMSNANISSSDLKPDDNFGIASKDSKKNVDLGKKMASKVEIYFLFSPTCTFCERLSRNLTAFPNVQPLQVTGEKIKNFKGMKKTEFATKETLSQYVSDGAVPVTVIHYKKLNKVTLLKGYQEKDVIYESIGRLF